MRYLRAVLWAVFAIGIACATWFAAHIPADAQPMRTSFYSQGRRNADGSRFFAGGFTAAHRSLPFGSQLQACYRGCVVVTVRDRGPAAWTGRSLDLSRGAARVIGLERVGVAVVDVILVGRAAQRRKGASIISHAEPSGFGFFAGP